MSPLTSPPSPANGSFASFVPARGLGNGHVMTVYAWARPRTFAALPEPEARLFRVSPDTQVLAHCYWQASPAGRPTLIALHGLEGSSSVHYMRGLADQAYRRGWNAVLLNQRNCGGTEHLTPGLYHSGLTADPRAVIADLAAGGCGPVVVCGYSLGGNLTLKLAGELGDSAELPIAAVAAVCPTMELDTCVRAIERPSNYAYQWNFMRNLRARMRRKAGAWPGAFDLTGLDALRTIRAFDDRYTAPYHGFDGASDYYHRASAMRVAARIRRPALILAAADDPFVPPGQFATPDLTDNAHVTVQVEPRGGHCGFVSTHASGAEAYWAEARAVEFLSRALR